MIYMRGDKVEEVSLTSSKGPRFVDVRLVKTFHAFSC